MKSNHRLGGFHQEVSGLVKGGFLQPKILTPFDETSLPARCRTFSSGLVLLGEHVLFVISSLQATSIPYSFIALRFGKGESTTRESVKTREGLLNAISHPFPSFLVISLTKPRKSNLGAFPLEFSISYTNDE